MQADFFQKILKITIPAGMVILFLAAQVPEADAFSLSLKRKAAQETRQKKVTSETSDYFIFFNVTDSGKVKQGAEAIVRDLNYKIVDRNGNLQVLLNDAQGGKIRFLDPDGFVVVETALLPEDLMNGDFYGSLPIDASRVERLSKADVVPLKPEAAEKLRLEREAADAARVEEENRAAALEAEQAAAVAEAAAENSAAEVQPQAAEDSFERGGVTNEDIQKVLEEFDNQRPTMIEPSKSEIDLKAEASKEENE